ncbi:uncharacterized protein LOC103838550 [Brassica rapa]|uniref:Uncharacterized protein n=1 Tax=Brassica napus TaxID=3708 RepID=A0ABQ8BY96_BRANA|nr:uncharacterized protein LOC103838550 [Brassica rapa]KAH0909754.1 hypothetical protein HID58_033075 [Brassica napus]
MTKRRFDKVEHFDKDSGSDSSCFSSDSDPEEAEESEEEVSEEGDESPADVDDDEPPEEEEEHYILGCMIKCQPGYECRYCPFITCPNERTMRAHVSSREKQIIIGNKGKLGTDDNKVMMIQKCRLRRE